MILKYIESMRGLGGTSLTESASHAQALLALDLWTPSMETVRTWSELNFSDWKFAPHFLCCIFFFTFSVIGHSNAAAIDY